jgi:hypothetical protein
MLTVTRVASSAAGVTWCGVSGTGHPLAKGSQLHPIELYLELHAQMVKGGGHELLSASW